MFSPPPLFTFFPYTTLFRSHVHPAAKPEFAGLGRRELDRGGLERGERHVDPEVLEHDPLGAIGGLVAVELQPIAPRDRKSTRLNSSHRCISYAVFCLKKKKK